MGDALHQVSDPDEPALGFDGNDGYYWFLHPLFERLAAETGQYIDLCGSVMFVGPDLHALTRMLADARGSVEAQPEAWEVQIAIAPALYRRVERCEFLQLLSVWERATSRAQESERAVMCFGDEQSTPNHTPHLTVRQDSITLARAEARPHQRRYGAC